MNHPFAHPRIRPFREFRDGSFLNGGVPVTGCRRSSSFPMEVRGRRVAPDVLTRPCFRTDMSTARYRARLGILPGVIRLLAAPGPQACREADQTGHQSSSEARVWRPVPLLTPGTHPMAGLPGWVTPQRGEILSEGLLLHCARGKNRPQRILPLTLAPTYPRAWGPETRGCTSTVPDPGAEGFFP